MTKHDVTKTPFPKKKINEFFWDFGCRRQIDAGEGTESFAGGGAGAESALPPSGENVYQLSQIHSIMLQVTYV